jgi:2-polyprenyl-3-methyl-5-hydroxy-6-metoxy-1,4-benzoquinol methylase
MQCYLCQSNSFLTRKGRVRDFPELKVIECEDCGLVTLDSKDHIGGNFYQNSGMHGLIKDELITIEEWLKITEIDDQRRFQMFKPLITNKSLLDFGCGNAGFLKKAKIVSSSVMGIELEKRVIDYYSDEILIFENIRDLNIKFDVITSFHVFEHLENPLEILNDLGKLLNPNGKIIIEVPNSDDALLTLFESESFQNFTYWSQHLFLFNSNSLKRLVKKSNLNFCEIIHFQRYPISNHLYWLSKNKPGGHSKWAFLDSTEIRDAYANALSTIGKTDTIIAFIEN